MDDTETRDQAAQEMREMAHEVAQQWLTDEQFAKRYRNTIKAAKRDFEKDGYHMNMVYAHFIRPNDAWMMVGMVFADWPPPGDRFEAMRAIGLKLADEYPDDKLLMLTHVSEGWAAADPDMVDPADPMHVKKGQTQPMDHPDRFEVMIVSALTIDQRQSYSCTPIKRDKAGNFRKWGKSFGETYESGTAGPNPFKTGDFLLGQIFVGYSTHKVMKLKGML